MTSSAPASRNRIRSSTSSAWVRHRTGIADRLGVARISRQTSAGVVAGPVTSMMTRLWSAASGDGLGGVLDDVDGVADAGQDSVDRLAGDGVGLEEEDGARGHVVSGGGEVGRTTTGYIGPAPARGPAPRDSRVRAAAREGRIGGPC